MTGDQIAHIAVMGATGSGKTTFINLVSGSSLRVGMGLHSCTSDVQTTEPFRLDNRWVVLIDTPGFDDTTKSDTDILKMIAAHLEVSYQGGQKLSGVVYIHRISDVRMGGISTRNFSMFRKLCGDSTLKNVVILTNMWGEVAPSVGEARERELATSDIFFKPVLDKQAQFLRHDNTLSSAQNPLRRLVQNRPLALEIQRELVDQRKAISETAAGAEIDRELRAQAEKHKAEMVELRADMKEAMNAKDDETRKELEIEYKKMETQMKRVQDESARLASNYNEEKVRLEQRMKEMEEAAREERERAAKEHEKKMSELMTQLQAASSQSLEERRALQEQMARLERDYQELRDRPRGGGCVVQ